MTALEVAQMNEAAQWAAEDAAFIAWVAYDANPTDVAAYQAWVAAKTKVAAIKADRRAGRRAF